MKQKQRKPQRLPLLHTLFLIAVIHQRYRHAVYYAYGYPAYHIEHRYRYMQQHRDQPEDHYEQQRGHYLYKEFSAHKYRQFFRKRQRLFAVRIVQPVQYLHDSHRYTDKQYQRDYFHVVPSLHYDGYQITLTPTTPATAFTASTFAEPLTSSRV